MKRWVIVGIFVLVVILAAIFGVENAAKSTPDFWKNFIPNVWANIIGVSVAAVIGVPIGFAINHYVATATEHRRHYRQIGEVRQLLEQVKSELDLHSANFFRLSQVFSVTKATRTSSTSTNTLGVDIFSTLILQVVFGRQFIGNHSVLEIGESLILFRVCSYYERIEELNRHIDWRIKDTQQPERWDNRIAVLTDSASLAQVQAKYEIEQAITRLTREGN